MKRQFLNAVMILAGLVGIGAGSANAHESINAKPYTHSYTGIQGAFGSGVKHEHVVIRGAQIYPSKPYKIYNSIRFQTREVCFLNANYLGSS